MNFAFSEEQEELRRTVRQFLEAKSPETEVRRLMETTEGYDPAVWKQMGQELGLQSLAGTHLAQGGGQVGPQLAGADLHRLKRTHAYTIRLERCQDGT